MAAVEGVEIIGPRGDRYDEILTPDALRLLASLQRELGPRRAAAARGARDPAGGDLGRRDLRLPPRDPPDPG